MTADVARRAPNEWWTGVVAGMASYIDAAAIVATGIALVIYQFTIGVTPGQIGIMSGALTFCVAIGALVGGRLGDRLGRRRVFIVTMVLIVAGSVLTTFGTAFPVLLPGVVLIGLGVGADLPVSLATIAESASDRNRGKLILLSNMLWVVGIVSSIAIASVSGDLGRLGGQLMFGQVGVVALLVLAARLTIPESDLWLKGRQLRDAAADAARPKARIRDLLQPPYAMAFLALLVFYTLTNLGANTTGSFNTFIAANFAGTTVEAFNRWALIALVIGLVPGLLFMKYVDTRKRMTFFVVGAVLATASYLYLAVVGFTLTTMVVSLFLAVVGNAFAFEGIMKVWTQESFPTMLRSTAQGGIVAFARVTAALLASVTPALLQANLRGTYIGLAVLAGVGYLVAGLAFRGARRDEFRTEPLEESTPAS
ncbi:inositol transporter-like SP family MFS transporter [Promicromonospora sp. AC04]|uniref:MFS transporter n=1 Tax=Promicromonospora sp. AC04 TaxID=2135723 RepID=UPI000D3B8726|nr:MFS transporter [Promicromonospora sp. AC04]PUB32017.1 inositol transporter-like SP family MFS transporter [Promicromonospora sp. AC04]